MHHGVVFIPPSTCLCQYYSFYKQNVLLMDTSSICIIVTINLPRFKKIIKLMKHLVMEMLFGLKSAVTYSR